MRVCCCYSSQLICEKISKYHGPQHTSKRNAVLKPLCIRFVVVVAHHNTFASVFSVFLLPLSLNDLLEMGLLTIRLIEGKNLEPKDLSGL